MVTKAKHKDEELLVDLVESGIIDYMTSRMYTSAEFWKMYVRNIIHEFHLGLSISFDNEGELEERWKSEGITWFDKPKRHLDQIADLMERMEWLADGYFMDIGRSRNYDPWKETAEFQRIVCMAVYLHIFPLPWMEWGRSSKKKAKVEDFLHTLSLLLRMDMMGVNPEPVKLAVKAA